MNLTGVKPAPTPMTRATGTGVRDALVVVASDEAKTFRRGAGIAMYIGHDRYDAQRTVKELASDVQNPTRMSIARLRRLVRYLCGTTDAGICFAYQDGRQGVTVWVYGDWSGNAETCKRTSSGATQIGKHTVETWSVNQKVIRLSPGESELYAIGSGAARSQTVKNVMQELMDFEKPGEKVRTGSARWSALG